MAVMILSVLSMIAFCFCCHFFLRSIIAPVPVPVLAGGYKRSALRVRKAYCVFAWGVLTTSFLFSLVVAFVQVYTTL